VIYCVNTILYLNLIHRVAESEDGCWQELLEVIWCNLPAQAWPPTARCSGLHSDSFWISPRMETTNYLGTLFQYLVTLLAKKCFLMFKWSLPCFILFPMPLVLSLGIS